MYKILQYILGAAAPQYTGACFFFPCPPRPPCKLEAAKANEYINYKSNSIQIFYV